jgi:single-strand DNA-binding protein
MPGRPVIRRNTFVQEAFMNNLNSILIEGNMVRDPLFRSTPKGTPLCTFSLASNRFFKQDSGLEKEVSFFEVETWSKLAETVYNLGHKGRGVRVVGRLKQDRWNGSDGKQRSRVTIVAEHVEFRPDFRKEGGDEKTEAAAVDAAIAEHSAAFSSVSTEIPGDAPAPAEELEPVTF